MAWSNEWKTNPWPVNEKVIVSELIDQAIKIEQHQNKSPTHDPYTNPGAYVYYQCECGEILDPHTKSFAALNNAASKTDWKIRWGANSYIPYCPKCVVEKGIER